jgi:hypothetical protein
VAFAHEREADHPAGGRTYGSKPLPNVPQWLVTSVGPDYFRKVESVSVVNAPVTDDWLNNLDKLPELESLLLRGTNATGDGIARLGVLRSLQRLDIKSMAGVNDRTLEVIGECADLSSLTLWDCREITDAGVAHLAPLVKLEQLNLSGSQLTDAGMVHLSGMTKMRMLNIEKAQVTDQGLKHLANMKEMYWLDLRGTGVTDEGLRHLEGMTKLWQLVLWDTKVTQAGAARIKAALPGLKLLPIGPQPAPSAPLPSPFPSARGRRGARTR